MTNLQKRIRRGRAWLHTHCQSHCEATKKAYDPGKYTNHLRTYEELVDQLPTETEESVCWKYDDTESLENGGLKDFEAEFIISYPELN